MPSAVLQECDAWVAHALDGAAIPSGPCLLKDWLAYDWSEVTHPATEHDPKPVNLIYLAQEYFWDFDVQPEGAREAGEALSDLQRLRHARRCFGRVILSKDCYLRPTVRTLQVNDAGGRCAVLGLTAPAHPMSRDNFDFHGAFRTCEAFLAWLKPNNFWPIDELESIEDERILSLWMDKRRVLPS